MDARPQDIARGRALGGACVRVAAGVLLALAARPAGGQAVTPLLVRADSLWGAGRPDSAAVLYRAALMQDSLASSRAVFRVATTLAWASRTDSALALFARYERMEPGDYGGPLARARTLAWASRYAPALGVLDSLSQAMPLEREIALFRAQVLAWAGDLSAAAARYRDWLVRSPEDDDARAGLARTLSWDGRFDDAAAEYGLLASRAPAEAAKGIARVTAWRGDLDAARAQWADVTVRFPTDPEGWTGLAQVERWQGRARDADRALAQALVVRPGYPDAISQRAWVRAELAPAGDVSVAYGNDSDQNRMLTTTVSGSLAPPWQGRATLSAQFRTAEFSAFRGTSTAVRLSSSWTPAGTAWTLRGEGGVTLLSGDDPTVGLLPIGGPPGSVPASRSVGTLLSYSVRASGPVAPRVVAGISASGGPFDETAVLIVRRIRSDGLDGDISITLPGRFTVGGGASWARIGNGATPNARLAMSGALRYAVTRGSWLGVVARTFGYDTTAGGDGYFAPQRFTLVEAAAHFELPKDIGWNVLADVGVGTQTIRIGSNPSTNKGAQRAQLGVLYRPIPGTEWSAVLWIANVASPFAATSEYRAGGLTARGRLVF